MNSSENRIGGYHLGDPCVFCDKRYDDVSVGDCTGWNVQTLARCGLEVTRLRAKIERLQQERLAIQASERALTCVFCGHVYPPGTPTANHEALREHVAVCPSHPAAQYRQESERLRTETQQWQSYGMARNEQLVEAKAEIERLREVLANAPTQVEVNIAETTGYNSGLEYAAKWIEGSASAEQKQFADNMAMSIRAAKVQIEQEDFFDAVRADTEMTPEQKARWLALEEETRKANRA